MIRHAKVKIESKNLKSSHKYLQPRRRTISTVISPLKQLNPTEYSHKHVFVLL